METSIRNKHYLAAVDLALLLLSFAVVHLYKYENLWLNPQNFRLLILLTVIWLGVYIGSNKTDLIPKLHFPQGVWPLIRANLILLGLLTLAVVVFTQWQLSRLMVYGPGVLFSILELVFFGLYFRFVEPQETPETETVSEEKLLDISSVSLNLVIVDVFLLIVAILVSTWIKRGELVFTAQGDVIAVLAGVWLVSSFISGKFNRSNFRSFRVVFSSAIKTTIVIAAGLAVIMYAFRVGTLSRLQIFGALTIFLALEIIVFYLYASWRGYSGQPKDVENVDEARALTKNESSKGYELNKTVDLANEPVRQRLEYALEFFSPNIFAFIDKHINLQAIDRKECTILNTENISELEALNKEGSALILNLQLLNDIRWLNRYFLLAHTHLIPGGYLVGKVHTITTNRELFTKKYSSPFDSVMYSFDFVWHRAIPKLPWVKNIYFAITKGRGRLVSRAEIFGRLHFCGYAIISEEEGESEFIFLARKVKLPSSDTNPSYGPLVQLNRHGLGGQPLTVYKFRTMYPYSEYLQEYIYANNQLDKGGKFKNDFRVTGWGRFMRRTWLDELPMLYNWLKGDLQLIGVRPLSAQYLSLYPQEMKDLRQKIKPGLLPPFYADMPKTFEEISQSEQKYIEQYLNRPIKTQWVYFWKAVYNIAIRGARSK